MLNQLVVMKLNKYISVGIVAAWGLLALAACTPADEQYCNGYGVQGGTEFGKCLDYYHQQDAAFKADLAICNLEADGTYPPSLYDYGHDVPVIGGFVGPHGTWYQGGGIEHIPPDYMHNAQVDALRMRIIAPCMQAYGWNSGSSWQAGRHAVSKPAKPLPPPKLPWQ
jgi:hypothetical protein